MGLISILLFATTIFAAPLPVFMSKFSSETLRFISLDGRYAYIQKKPGVLGLITNFKSTDFLSESEQTNHQITSSRFKNRLIIESISNFHSEMNLLKNNVIHVVDYGNIKTREVGKGRSPKLHLQDEWISFYDIISKEIKIQNLVSQKSYVIKTIKKDNPFFVPEVEMVSSQYVVYTDINSDGFSALIQYDLISGKGNVLQKSALSGTKIELCSHQGYLAYGEFPYDGVERGSKIQLVKLNGGSNLASATSIYESSSQDIGNMICMQDSIYFVKTLNADNKLNFKVTEAVNLDLSTQEIKVKTQLKAVAQILEMDNRVMIPFRGELLVLEGQSNLSSDALNKKPSKEELQLDI